MELICLKNVLAKKELSQEEIIAKSYEMGEKSIIDFRRLFIPSEEDAEEAWFHHEWDKILREGTQHYAIEAFRESAKGQLCIRGFLLYRLVYPVKEQSYIIILKANQTDASKKLKEAITEYKQNPWLCANLVRINEENQKAFDCIVKDKHGNEINIRIESYGKGSGIRGISYMALRPQLIIADDIQDTGDSQSDTIQQADWEWFNSDVIYLGKKTRIFLIGNNLGAKCLIERCAEGAELLNFQFVRIPILDIHGKSNWESYWKTEDVIAEREKARKLGTIANWMREKMCIAVAPEKQIFKKEMFRYYNKKDLDLGNMSVFTTVDLAISTKDTADYTSICTIAVNPEGHWFILDIRFGRWNPTEGMDELFKVVLEYRPLYTGIEKVAYQSAFKHFLEKEMPKRNIFFTVKDLLASAKKELRIEAIQPRFASGTIWFPEDAEFLAELESELLCFPKALHDDLLDSLAYMPQIVTTPIGAYASVNTEDIPFAGEC